MQPADTLNVKARRKAGRRIEIINSKTINVWEQWVTRKTFTAYTDAQIKAAESNITTLGINGYLQEDILVASGNTKASGTVVYAGEIYQYMFDEEVVAILQKITTLPQIVWVQ